MKLHRGRILLTIACVSLGACHGHGFGTAKTPTGQVVATVGGQEITLRELQAELTGTNLPSDPKALKAIEGQALQEIIARKLVAKAALEEGLDKTPDFALQKQRMEENLLAQTLQAKLVKNVPAPTREEAESFVSNHPDIFSERKIFSVDQIQMTRPSDPNLIKEIQPLNTMDDIEALLTREHVQYRRGASIIDAVGVDPDMVAAIVKLPPNEVFVVPGGSGVLINQIKDTKVVPFTGEPAVTYATALLKRQHTEEAVTRQIKMILAKGASSVRYNAAYQPPKPVAPAAPAASASNAAAPSNAAPAS